MLWLRMRLANERTPPWPAARRSNAETHTLLVEFHSRQRKRAAPPPTRKNHTKRHTKNHTEKHTKKQKPNANDQKRDELGTHKNNNDSGAKSGQLDRGHHGCAARQDAGFCSRQTPATSASAATGRSPRDGEDFGDLGRRRHRPVTA